MTEQTRQQDNEAEYDLGGSDQITAIKEKLHQKQHNHSELNINRVPDKAINQLQELAYDKFAGDYGMALTFLLELKELKDEFDTQLQATTSKVMELEEEVEQLKQTSSQNEDGDNGRKTPTIG